MIAPRSLWLACADRKPLIKDDSWEKALAAYDAEMDEACLRTARAMHARCVRRSDQIHLWDAHEVDANALEVIEKEKARRGDE